VGKDAGGRLMRTILRALGKWTVRRGQKSWPAERLTINGAELEEAGIVGKFAEIEISPGAITIRAVSLTAPTMQKDTTPPHLPPSTEL
jgi:hypothetical protein